MPAWVEQGVAEYSRRLPAHWRFTIREINQSTAGTPQLMLAQEAKSLLSAISDKSHVVALDNRGSALSTKALAGQLESWQGLGKPVVLLVGGPSGLHESCRQRADELWSLSPLTFPHPLVRVIVVEQLYRAFSILSNHPYHRA